jgi:predicted PurR-regulated permease PerM
MDSTLWIVLIVVVVICIILAIVGFLMLVFTLVPAVHQLRSTLVEVEKTTSQTRDLVANLKSVSGKIDQDLDKVDAILDSSRETVDVVKHSLKFVNKNLLKQSVGLMALIPAIKFGWNLVQKYKGGKDV